MTQLTLSMASHKRSHYASIADSPRLQRALSLLSDYQPHTSREIREYADVSSVSTTIDELRKNCCVIECRFVRTTETNARVYEYRLIKGVL